MRAAIDGDPTLGGAVESARVVGFGPYDTEDVLGAEFAVGRVDVELIG